MEIVSASDHDAIYLTIQVAEPMSNSIKNKKLKCKEERKKDFVDEMKKAELLDIGTNDVNDLNDNLVEGISNAAGKSGMYRKPGNAGDDKN